jgi:hypothetical protein
MKLKDLKKTEPIEPVTITPNKSVLAAKPATKPGAAKEKPQTPSSQAAESESGEEPDKGGRKSGKEPGVAYERIGGEIKADNKELLKIATAMGDFLDPSRALDYAIEQTFGKKYGKF